jgi:hypothetical protein
MEGMIQPSLITNIARVYYICLCPRHFSSHSVDRVPRMWILDAVHYYNALPYPFYIHRVSLKKPALRVSML